MSLIIEGMKMPEYRDVFGDERGCVYLLMLTVNKDGAASMQFNDVDGGFYRVKEIRLEEKHRNVLNYAGKMYDENLRLKREVDSLKLVFRLLLNKEG